MRRDLFFGPLQDRISRCFILLFMLLSVGVWGQVTIFSENVGTATGTTSIATNNFQNSNLVFTGSGDTRSTSPSNTYSGFSGNRNVFITNAIGTNFEISNINTIGYTNISLTFGQLKSLTTSVGLLVIEVSSDGITYTPLSYTRTDGAVWALISPTGTIPATSNLRIRFTNPATNQQYRIDDIILKGILPTISAPTVTTTSVSGITTTNANSGGNVTADGGASVTARGVYYGTSTVPATGTSDGSGIGSFISSLSSLSVNTRYFYRAYATNSAGTGYGVESSFFTLANVPSIPVIATPTTSSLNVTIAPGGNPSITEYAIHETATNQFVQANGSLGATVAWQTSATWGTKTVTGLTPSTSYTFETKARNGTNVETAYSSTASGTTLANETLDYWNLQSPVNQTISQGSTFEVYAQAYKLGLTEAAGASAGLSAWIGYSSSNTNPNTAGWTWIPATFNVQAGNNDEFKATLGAGLLPGTYYYASRFQLNTSTYSYGGVGGDWNNTSGILTVNSNKVNWANIQSPVSGTIVIGNNYTVYSQVNKPGITGDANSHSGITAWIGYSSTNDNPSGSGWTWVSATRNTGFSNTSNDEYSAEIGSGRLAGTYYYASRYQVTGSTEYFYGGHSGGPDTGGEWGNPSTNVSGILTVQTPQDINIKQGTNDILTNGTYAFGNQASGSTGAAVVFTIQNIGQTNLDLTDAPKIVKSGTNAAEFTVDETTTTSPVTGNGSTTFTVTFSPTSLGAKAAQLSIANNDAIGNENPYIINLTGTGTASATSNIITNTAFSYSPINYLNYINSNITLANSFELGQFIIQDGGGSADADNLATTLSSLSLSVGNFANLEKLAIYDGSIEVAEVTAASTTTFPTLSLTAADGGTKTFSIRGSFKSTVTDNQRITLTVSSATAAVTGSTFGSITATTSNTGTDNVIQVVADRLAFTTQPTNTGVSAAMSNVVVSATDINNNKDLDYSGNVSITSTGTLTGSPVIVATTSGAATFSGLTHTLLGTGLSLSATSTGLASATSSAFDITTIAYADGDFMTKTGGTWTNNATGTATWYKRVGGIWSDAAGEIPNGTSGLYTIFITENIQVPAAGPSTFNTGKVHVLNNAVLTFDNTGSSWIFRGLIIDSGSTVQMNGRFRVDTNGFNIKNGGNFIYKYESGGFNAQTAYIFAGVENFEPNSNFILKDVNGGNFLEAAILNAITVNSENSYFGNIIVDYSAGSGTLSFFSSNAQTAAAFSKVICNDLIFRTSNGSVRFYMNTTSGIIGSASPIKIGGNFITESTFSNNINFTTAGTTGTLTLNVAKDFILNSGAFYFLNGSSTSNTALPVLNIGGNMTLFNNSKFAYRSNVGNTATITVNLSKNLFVDINASLTDEGSNAFTFGHLFFNGTVPQTIDFKNQNSNVKVSYSIRSGANVSLVNQDLSLGTNSKFNVLSGGTLDFGFNGTTALNLIRVSSPTLSAGQSFSAAAGSTLKISSPDGISNGTSVYTGNVQVGSLAANRIFDPAATYHFVGKANVAQVVANGVDQISGNGLPSDASAKNIIVELNTSNSAQDDVSFKALNINKFTNLGSLKIIKGTVIDEAGNGFADGTAEDGKLIMSGGRYKISRGGTQPSIGGDYNLTGGVIEFAGSSAIQVRTGSTPKEYLNVEVSGTNVKAGTTDAAGLTFQSGGKFTVKGTGIFKVPNADGFSGGTATAIKNANTPTITLESLSTVDYTGANQTVTVDLPYQNLNISGTGTKSPVTNLTVNNITSVTAGTLKILETADDAMPNVFTSKKGVQIGTSGNLVLANNANLMQDESSVINSGRITAQRIAKLKFESIAKADYNYWSSPVKDQKLLYNGATPLVTSFSPGTPNNRIFEYKESTDTFVATANPNFVAGKGYAIRAENAQNGSTYTADGTAKIFEFLGEPNNGDISTPSLTWKDANHGYNVIGNPYPSNINFDSFWSANQSRMYSTAYFWTNNQYTPNQQGSGYTGSNYAIYNGTGGNSAAYQVTSGSPVVPNEYIKPGQGFIVQTKSAGVLNFNNSMREVGVSPFFNNKTNSSKNRFWLSFTSPSSIVNDILVGYIQGASNGFEKDFDAPLLVEGSDSFFSILGAQKLAIQGKNALFTMDDVVPVGTKYFENGIYKIALSQKEGLFESQNIYLKDRLLNKTVNLASGDYTFTAVKGTDVTRFEIVYKDEAVLGTDTATKSDFIVYKDGSDYVIKSSKILGKVEVYDTAGRMVVSKKTTENNIRLNAATLTNGVYIIKAENSGDVRTKKVIK